MKKENRRRTKLRRQSGLQLIELMFAISVTGFLAVTLAASLAQTIQTSQKAEANLLPSFIAQAMLDRIRALPYPVPAGTYAIPINSDDSVPVLLPSIQQNPLVVDASNYTYSQGVAPTGPPYEFKGNASITVTSGPTDTTTNLPFYVQLVANVSWPPGSDAPQAYQVTTIISEGGFHN